MQNCPILWELLHSSHHHWEGQSSNTTQPIPRMTEIVSWAKFLRDWKKNVRGTFCMFARSFRYCGQSTIDPFMLYICVYIDYIVYPQNHCDFHLIWKSESDVLKLARYWNSTRLATRFPILQNWLEWKSLCEWRIEFGFESNWYLFLPRPEREP